MGNNTEHEDRSRLELFGELLQAAPDAMVVVDAHGRILLVNAQVTRIFGYAAAELIGEPVERLLPTALGAAHRQHLQRFVAAPRARPMGACDDLRGVRKDGSEFPAEIMLSPITTPDGVLITAAIRDVSERKHAEAARRRSLELELDNRRLVEARSASEARASGAEAQLRAVLDAAPDFIGFIDRDGVIRFVNRGTADRRAEDIVGTSWLAGVPGEDHDRLRATLAAVLESGAPARFQVSAMRPGGGLIWYAVHLGRTQRGVAADGAVFIAQDITAQKQAADQAAATERMASIGSLAAGVAHEINNPLVAVLGSLELAHDRVAALAQRADVGDLRELIAEAREAADQVRTIAADLKLLARAEEDHREVLDVRAVLESATRMAWNQIRHRARLHKALDHVPGVAGNEARLGQVFLNLLINAAQAIPEGEAERHEIRVTTRVVPGRRIAIDISDTGDGIAADVLPRLFTPFFTTKPVGIGTGLGLAICDRIVRSLGGEIQVRSVVGEGSTFTVLLPITTATMAAVVAPPPAIERRACRRGRVLVVDDNPLVARTIARTLAAHDVHIVHRGDEVLARLRRGEHFDVLLCDLMMPEMTGMELHAALHAWRPELAARIIFVTGGAFSVGARRFLEDVANPRLAKPFDGPQLRALVDRYIAGADP